MAPFRSLFRLLLAFVVLAWFGPSALAAPPAAPPAEGGKDPGKDPAKDPGRSESGAAEPPKSEGLTEGIPTGEGEEETGPETKPGEGPAVPTAAGTVDTATRETELYGDRILGLRTEVDDLKDRIFRSKARLTLLKETVLQGVLGGSRVILAHRNLMGTQFRLVKIAVYLDGAQVFARNDTSQSDRRGTLDQEDEVVYYDGNLVPGPHTITIEVAYQGRGFGIFSYLNDYSFDSRSEHGFTAPENGAIRVLSVGYERGNLTTEMRDRPSVDWQEIPLDASGKPLPRSRFKKAKKDGK